MLRVLQTVPAMPPSWIYRNREEAGRQLAKELSLSYAGVEAIVLAVPRGGVPVGAAIAFGLGAPLDVIVPRKIPIPWDPEAGLGAVTADGTIVLNEEIVPLLGLTHEQIVRVAREVQQEVQRRTRVYRGSRPPAQVEGKLVVLTDDGLATGLTMVAAIRSLRPAQPRRIVVAVPVAPRSSLERVDGEADEVVCLIEQMRGPFAVASYYRDFPDLTDEEVIATLRQYRIVQA